MKRDEVPGIIIIYYSKCVHHWTCISFILFIVDSLLDCRMSSINRLFISCCSIEISYFAFYTYGRLTCGEVGTIFTSTVLSTILDCWLINNIMWDPDMSTSLMSVVQSRLWLSSQRHVNSNSSETRNPCISIRQTFDKNERNSEKTTSILFKSPQIFCEPGKVSTWNVLASSLRLQIDWQWW